MTRWVATWVVAGMCAAGCWSDRHPTVATVADVSLGLSVLCGGFAAVEHLDSLNGAWLPVYGLVPTDARRNAVTGQCAVRIDLGVIAQVDRADHDALLALPAIARCATAAARAGARPAP